MERHGAGGELGRGAVWGEGRHHARYDGGELVGEVGVLLNRDGGCCWLRLGRVSFRVDCDNESRQRVFAALGTRASRALATEGTYPEGIITLEILEISFLLSRLSISQYSARLSGLLGG